MRQFKLVVMVPSKKKNPEKLPSSSYLHSIISMTTPNKPTPTTAMDGPAMIELLKQAEKAMPMKAEILNHQTRILWLRYCLLRDKGFSEQQAIHLCHLDWNHAV